MVSALGFASFVFLAWQAIGKVRPAPIGVAHEPEITLRASAWTHAFCAGSLVFMGTIGIGMYLQGGRAAPFGIPFTLAFGSLIVWLWADFSQTLIVEHGSVRVRRPLGKERTLSFETITKLDVSPPYFIVEARFADGTRLTFFPTLFNADEGARRVLIGAPAHVVAAVKGPAGEAIRRLREEAARRPRTDPA